MKTVACTICGKEFEVSIQALDTCPESNGWKCSECCKSRKCEKCK